MKIPYKVLSASALSALVTVPVLATPAFAQDVTYGDYNFNSLTSIPFNVLGDIQAQGPSNHLYNTYFDRNGFLVEHPITVEINEKTVNYNVLTDQIAQNNGLTVSEYLNQNGVLPVVEAAIEGVEEVTEGTEEITVSGSTSFIADGEQLGLAIVNEDSTAVVGSTAATVTDNAYGTTIELSNPIEEGGYLITASYNDDQLATHAFTVSDEEEGEE